MVGRSVIDWLIDHISAASIHPSCMKPIKLHKLPAWCQKYTVYCTVPVLYSTVLYLQYTYANGSMLKKKSWSTWYGMIHTVSVIMVIMYYRLQSTVPRIIRTFIPCPENGIFDPQKRKSSPSLVHSKFYFIYNIC